MEIFSFCFDSSKTNTKGHIETIGAARHLDALPRFFLIHVYDVEVHTTVGCDDVSHLGGYGGKLEERGYDFPWYGHLVYVNKYGKEMGYEG
eukprot:scaffold2296_cov853-Pavlova_lutheri.AAC.4